MMATSMWPMRDDCNDADASIFPNNARFEDDDLVWWTPMAMVMGCHPSVAADPEATATTATP